MPCSNGMEHHALCGFVFAGLGAAGASGEDARRLDTLERAFHDAAPRWRGGDAAYSTDLGDGRCLWLFGDSWIVPPEADGRRGGHVVRNTIAIQTRTVEGLSDIAYRWGGMDQDDPATAHAFFRDGDEDEPWLWPLSALRLKNTLCLFFPN